LGSLIAIEDYAYGKVFRQAQKGELHGIVKWELTNHGTFDPERVVQVSPSTLKKFVSPGKGKVEKSMILKEVYKKWGWDAPNDDEADAFVLAKMMQRYTEYLRGDLPTKKEEEVFKSLEKGNPTLRHFVLGEIKDMPSLEKS